MTSSFRSEYYCVTGIQFIFLQGHRERKVLLVNAEAFMHKGRNRRFLLSRLMTMFLVYCFVYLSSQLLMVASFVLLLFLSESRYYHHHVPRSPLFFLFFINPIDLFAYPIYQILSREWFLNKTYRWI